MPVGSFNKKTQQAFDQRVAASDSAQAAGVGGIIFNAAGSAQSTPTNYVPYIIGAVVALLIWSVINLRK